MLSSSSSMRGWIKVQEWYLQARRRFAAPPKRSCGLCPCDRLNPVGNGANMVVVGTCRRGAACGAAKKVVRALPVRPSEPGRQRREHGGRGYLQARRRLRRRQKGRAGSARATV